jgi:S-adenosylmethionine synthetase
MSVWSDQVFLTGGIVTRTPLRETLPDIVRRVGRQVGYAAGTTLDAARYVVHDTVCQSVDDPRVWTDRVNDQCITVGWAGYDAKTCWLPPEHFLAQTLGGALAHACRIGPLSGEGPDGKLLVRLREQPGAWEVEHVLVTMQQREETAFVDLVDGVVDVLGYTYAEMRRHDRRWTVRPDDIEVLANPNGPLVNGGSEGDNGQTSRKLVIDYYGPRVAIGGGALAGKDFSHIDRAAAYGAREAAVRAVATGARECRIVLAYAPNLDAPLEVTWEMDGRGDRCQDAWFAHSALRERYTADLWSPGLSRGRHFADVTAPWNTSRSPNRRHAPVTEHDVAGLQQRHPRV